MEIKKFYKYYKMFEELRKDKTSLVFKLNEEGKKIYNVKVKGGKIPKGKEIIEESNSLNEIINLVYKKYNKNF